MRALDPGALDPGALDAVALDAVALDPITIRFLYRFPWSDSLHYR